MTGLGFHLADVGGGPLAPAVALGDYDLVVLAALVGRTPARSAGPSPTWPRTWRPARCCSPAAPAGVRTLLYPAVDRSALAGFDVLGVSTPPTRSSTR